MMLDTPASDDAKLNVETLVSMFMAAEDATHDARKLAERDKDYYDGKQLSEEELKALRKRRQPEYIDNRIKPKIDYLVGLEKDQRVDPRAWPRTAAHEQDAEGATQGLKYVSDTENFDYKRSMVWENMLVYGAGGYSVTVKPSRDYGDNDIVVTRVPWDRMFWDPASAEPDFTDAGYLGTVQWQDYDDALALYPDQQDALDVTLASVTASDTYDDKPKWTLWADKKRRRVRIVEIWLKRAGQWHFAEFTKGGILKAGPSPYVNDKGESDCGLRFQSAYVDRDNNRYGLVREMILLQDAINKRNSKALHLLNTSQVVAKKGAVDNVERARTEASRPDGWGEVNEMGGALNDHFQFNTRVDLAQGQFLLLQEAKNSIDLKGPNATAMGDKAQGSAAASGKAIIASQQGGMMTLGGLLDNLRRLDIEVFRAIWFRIRQYWTAERWVRVTDDERNVKWVGINVDPQRVAMASPEEQQMIAGAVQNVADLDCDIIIDEAPDSVVPALEQFEALVQLKQFDTQGELTFEDIILAAPHLKNKDKILKRMRERKEQAQQNPQAQVVQQLQVAGAEADVQDKRAAAMLKEAQARKAISETGMTGQGEGPSEIDIAKALADIRNVNAGTAKTVAETEKIHVEAALKPIEMRNQQAEQQMARQERVVFKHADMRQAQRQSA